MARRDMLRQFLGELIGAIGSGGNVGVYGGRFRDPRVLRELHGSLVEELKAREKLADAGAQGSS